MTKTGNFDAFFREKYLTKNTRIENGDTKMDVEMLVRLSAILQAPLNVIVGVTDELTSPEMPL